MRNIVKRLRRKLGEDASNPAFIFAVPRVGYRMEKGEGRSGRRPHLSDLSPYSPPDSARTRIRGAGRRGTLAR